MVWLLLITNYRRNYPVTTVTVTLTTVTTVTVTVTTVTTVTVTVTTVTVTVTTVTNIFGYSPSLSMLVLILPVF